MTIDTRIGWLKTGAAITLAFGLLMAAAAVPALQAPTEVLLDLIYFPIDQGQTMERSSARLLSAISGGLMTGLGVILWLVATELCPSNPALGRRLTLLGIGSWYIVDSSMSLAAGAPLNVLLNTGFLLIFYVPAWQLTHAASA
ncbi:MAG: hypothetical protein QNJ05_12030 [Woeseiaceae bacterium]|nr:hypothetical protein [Woeseiaceae bacterium]